MTATIVPLAERHFAGLRQALDVVAREQRYLAFTAAPPVDAAYAFYRDIVEHDLVAASADGLADHFLAAAESVGRRGVDQVDSRVQRGLDGVDGLAVIRVPTPDGSSAQHPCAQPDDRRLDARIA